MRRNSRFGLGTTAFVLSCCLVPQAFGSDSDCATSAEERESEAARKAAAADRNGDGFVTKEEHSLAPQDLRAIDLNGDNRIQTSEYRDWLLQTLNANCAGAAAPAGGPNAG